MEKSNANNKKLENALDYSMKLLNSGATIEDCLKLYPNQRRELRSLLEAATALKTAYPGYPELRPSKLYAKTARAEFISAIENGVPASRPKVREPKTAKSNLFVLNGLYRRVAFASTAAAAAIVIAAGGLVYASGDSMPGTPLYAAKRTAEKIQLAFALSPESKAKLHYSFAQRRIDEARHMAKAGKEGEVAGISKEAKESLDEASKVAKVVPPVEKDKIVSEIESLNNTAKLQMAKEGSLPGSEGADETPLKAPVAGEPKSGHLGSEDNTGAAAPIVTAKSGGSAGKTLGGVSNSKSSASLMPFEIAVVTVSDRYMSPNNDTIKDTVDISIKEASSERFTVELYKGSVPVAVIAEQKTGKDLEFTWDGMDIDGNKVADGEYMIRVVNSIGQVAHAKAKVTVDTAPPVITLIEPPSGIQTEVLRPRFVWQANEGVTTSALRIYNDDFSREIVGLTEGFHMLDTDLQPGTWRWVIIATDNAGNASRSEVRTLIIIEPDEGVK